MLFLRDLPVTFWMIFAYCIGKARPHACARAVFFCKNTYFKRMQAPVGVKAVLKAWMELG